MLKRKYGYKDIAAELYSEDIGTIVAAATLIINLHNIQSVSKHADVVNSD